MGSVPSRTLQQCGPRDARECALAGEPAATSTSLLLPVGVPTIAGAGIGHTAAASHAGGDPDKGGASSSRSGAVAHAHPVAAAALKATPATSAAGISSLLKGYGIVKGIETVCLDYLPDIDYNKFQREGVVPKRETGMLGLARKRIPDGMPEWAEHLSIQSVFEVPSNQRVFSIPTSDTTIPSILQLLSPCIPWNITMLALSLDSKTQVEDLNNVITMLPAIVTALEHVKHIVLRFNFVQFDFNIGNCDDKLHLAEIGRNNVVKIRNILTTVAKFPGGAAVTLGRYMLSSFPLHKSLSSELHSVTLQLNLTRSIHDLAFCRKLAATNFDPRLRISVQMNHVLMADPKTLPLLHLFSSVSLLINERNEAPILLDFSAFDRMVDLSATCVSGNRFAPIIMPRNQGNLEKMTIHLVEYESGPTFLESGLHPNLREVYINALPSGSVTRLDSNILPVLKQFSCASVPVDATLDLSGIKNPGLNLKLLECKGTLILPKAAIGRLTISRVSLECAAIKDALPTVHDLDICGITPTIFKKLAEILHGTSTVAVAAATTGAGAGANVSSVAGAGNYAAAAAARKEQKEEKEETRGEEEEGDEEGDEDDEDEVEEEQEEEDDEEDADSAITSLVLERLKLGGKRCVKIRMGEFRYLQSLELYNISIGLDGLNFPQLDSLILDCSTALVIGDFPHLTALRLRAVSIDMHVYCTAPMLTELECTDVLDAPNVVVGPASFPALRSIIIRPANSPKPARCSLPAFVPPHIPSAWSRAITVFLDESRLSFTPHLNERADLIRRYLPECLLSKDIIG